MTFLLERAPTGDFQEAAGPFDLAKGTLRVSQAPDDAATGFKLTVEDIEGAEGQEFGAHLHTGPCIDGDYAIPGPTPGTTLKPAGSQAGPHYNHEVHYLGKAFPKPGESPSDTIAEVSTETEAWFSLVPNDHGEATDDTKVNFVPLDLELIPGQMSIVIHVSPTNPATGGAGARQACFSVLTPSDWKS
jgi:Cu/Zn superoxide dismutase